MIYVSSKVRHARLWQALRTVGWPISSSWIDRPVCDRPDDLALMWSDFLAEVGACKVLVGYAERGDVAKGALIEIEGALACGRPVLLIPSPGTSMSEAWPGTWIHRPLVQLCDRFSVATSRLIEMGVPIRR